MLLSLAGDLRVCQVVNAPKTCRMELARRCSTSSVSIYRPCSSPTRSETLPRPAAASFWTSGSCANSAPASALLGDPAVRRMYVGG